MTSNKRLYLCVMAAVWIAVSALEAGAQSLIFPHFAQGDGCQTIFTLNNLSVAAATVSIDFVSQAGAVMRTSTITLAASAAASIEPQVPSPFVGWARMTISPASSQVFATETIRLLDSSGFADFRDGHRSVASGHDASFSTRKQQRIFHCGGQREPFKSGAERVPDAAGS